MPDEEAEGHTQQTAVTPSLPYLAIRNKRSNSRYGIFFMSSDFLVQRQWYEKLDPYKYYLVYCQFWGFLQVKYFQSEMRLEEYPTLRQIGESMKVMSARSTCTLSVTERLDYLHPYSRMI